MRGETESKRNHRRGAPASSAPADAPPVLPEETVVPAVAQPSPPLNPPSAGGCRAGPRGTGGENELALAGNLETPSGHSSNSWL